MRACCLPGVCTTHGMCSFGVFVLSSCSETEFKTTGDIVFVLQQVLCPLQPLRTPHLQWGTGRPPSPRPPAARRTARPPPGRPHPLPSRLDLCSVYFCLLLLISHHHRDSSDSCCYMLLKQLENCLCFSTRRS